MPTPRTAWSSAQPAGPDPGPGARLGRYVLGEEVGRGGMGVVYRAHDGALGRDVAVKVLPAGLSRDPEAVARLRAEARAASALDHPHVCTVYEVGEGEPDADGRPGPLFVAMAFYEGETLDARLARGPLPVAEAVSVARQVALGLGAAHRKGVVHRDVKPSNVFVTDEPGPDGGPCVKLLDFGVAHVEGAPLTRPGTTLGTLEYAAPEQAHGEVGPASDQWGLGVVLYEMLAGRRPFDEPYEAALLYAVLNEAPAPVRDARPDAPEALAAVVGRLLAKRPADRYASADEAAAVLATALADGAGPAHATPRSSGFQPSDHRPSTRSRLTRRWAAVSRRGRLALAAAVLVLTVGAAWAAVARALPDEKHVAVLPFRAVGGGPEGQAFADGLVETLASGLTQLEQHQGALWVVPASEVRGQGVESPSAARRVLGATLVVTGSVQRAGGRVRVPLALVDAGTLRQVRAETVDVPEARLPTLSAEIAAAVESMLDLELRPQARAGLAAGGTRSAEAYDALTQGVGYLDRYTDPANVTRAIALFRRAVALDPGYALAHAQLGEAYAQRFLDGRDERWLVRAEAAAREALGRAPEAAAVHALLSKVARRRGDAASALASARRAVALDPASEAPTLALAYAYAEAGDDTRAEQAYLRAVRIKPGYWSTHNRFGLFYYDAGRWGEAAERFREAVRLAPGNSEALLNLGGALWMDGRAREARALFEQSIAAQPNARAYSNVGTMDYNVGRFAEAVTAYRRSLTLDASDAVVWGNLASTYDTLGRAADARQAYAEGARRAEAQIAVNPRDADLHATVAGFYVELGRVRDARRAAARASELDPPVDAQVALAGVYGALGDSESARRWLQQALAEGYPRDLAAADPAVAPYINGAR